jgi:hypothetical protein
MQAVSVDEALIDVENTRRYAAGVNRDATQFLDFAEELAQTIRAKVKNATSCEGARVSILAILQSSM